MQIRHPISRHEPAPHPEWTAFISKIERKGSPLSNSSQKRVDALIRTQIREGRPFFWFCMMAYQNGFLFSNKQKEVFKDEFPITYKWIRFQQENIPDKLQQDSIFRLFLSYESGELNIISLLNSIYDTLLPAQQTRFLKDEWFQNICRWREFAASANITKAQQDHIADIHAETMICTANDTETYRRMLGKIYHSRINSLSNEQKVKMRESYQEIDFLVDINSTNKLTATNKRRRVAPTRWAPVDNVHDKRVAITSIAPDDSDDDENTASYSSSDSASSSTSSSSSSDSSSSDSSSTSSSMSSSDTSSSDDKVVAPPLPNAPIMPLVTPISLFNTLRRDITPVECELKRRQAIRLAKLRERHATGTSELPTTRDSDFNLAALVDAPERDNQANQIVLDPASYRP